MLKVVKRLKEHLSGKKGTDKITVTIDANTDPLMAKLDKIKNAVENIKADATPEVSPTLTAYGLHGLSIEGVELPDHAGFSESFIAELDKALNDYKQKQEQSSQHTSTPRVRIEFDDINDVPHVWVDGKRIDRSDTGIVSVSLDWHTKDPAATDHVIRAYKIEYLKGDHREGIAQGSAMGPDLFKNDIHAK
ncbi:hydrolase [Lactobacillus phage LJ]|uniref:Hydrolase activity protein n=1 Tax=Lactobacillus phage LJ TaxID=2041454 RepID=A0A2D1GPN0_9CAUD|nr:hydrolase [Lactobacillus phage LJ]ATN93893.1 hydrolase activity protein [Lactobacillus phage LJ]